MSEKIIKTEDEWREELTPQQYHILREKGTEAAFPGVYFNAHDKGEYLCAACGAKLFSSDTKFDSGTGWPSFWQPVSEENIDIKEDKSFGMRRIEVKCSRCGGHLGHLFGDGPEPTVKRFCINSASLKLRKSENRE